MDTKMTKEEIRTRVLAIAGFQTNENQAPQVYAQVNGYIENVVEDIMADMYWSPRTATVDVNLGIDQTVLNFPTDYAGAAIESVDMWREDYGAFQPLIRARLPTALQDDLLAAEDPAQYEQQRSTPLYYDFTDQIVIWPRNDEARTVRITFQTNGTFSADEDVAPVDGLLVVYRAVSELFLFQDRATEAGRYEQKYQDRLGKLKRKQADGLVANTGASYRRRMDAGQVNPYINYGTWPTALP